MKRASGNCRTLTKDPHSFTGIPERDEKEAGAEKYSKK